MRAEAEEYSYNILKNWMILSRGAESFVMRRGKNWQEGQLRVSKFADETGRESSFS